MTAATKGSDVGDFFAITHDTVNTKKVMEKKPDEKYCRYGKPSL
jgi:hypothetical protein